VETREGERGKNNKNGAGRKTRLVWSTRDEFTVDPYRSYLQSFFPLYLFLSAVPVLRLVSSEQEPRRPSAGNVKV